MKSPVGMYAPRQRFFASVAIVAGGTISAQIVNFFGYLLATYYLSPFDFGLFGAHVAISAPLAIIATGRYEAAMIRADFPNRVINLVVLCMVSSFVFASITCAALWAAKGTHSLFSAIEIPVIFLLVLGQACLNCVIQLNNFARRYSMIAYSRFFGSVAAQVTLFTLASYGFGSLALALGLIAGTFVSIAISIYGNFSWLHRYSGRVSRLRVFAMARRYLSYTIYNGPQALASALQETAAIAVITGFFGHAATGIYVLANRLMGAPISIVAESMGRVLQRHFADMAGVSHGRRKIALQRYILGVAIMGLATGLGSWLIGPPVIRYAFSSDWASLADMVRNAAPYYASYLVGATLVSIPLATGDHKPIAAMGVFGSALYVISLAVAGTVTGDLATGFSIVSAVMVAYFICLTYLIYYSVIIRKRA